MRKLRIALVGGGIGGVTAALALIQRGFSPRIYEQAAELREVGAGIQITPNSAKVLRALGLERELAELSFEPECIAARNSVTGELLSRVPTKNIYAASFGARWYQIHRADLLDILVRALPPGVVHTHANVTGLTQANKHATLTFADNCQETFDVVVGCDGIHSTVREVLFGKEAPHFAEHMCWRAVVPTESLPPGLVAPDLTAWTEPGARVVTYYLRRGELVNIVAFREVKQWIAESWSMEGDPREMCAAYAHAHPDLQRLLSSVTRCFKWGVFDRDPLPYWTKGCVTLLGDAAHPMLPFLAQGSAMAIEDGYVLAHELVREKEVSAALTRYEAERRPRTSRVQLAARAQGEAIRFDARSEELNHPLGNSNAKPLKQDWIFSYDPVVPTASTATV